MHIMPSGKESHRSKLLVTLVKEGSLPVKELSEKTGLTERQVLDNAFQAKREGMVKSLIDQETGLIAYRITPDGRIWVDQFNARRRELSAPADKEKVPPIESAPEESEPTEIAQELRPEIPEPMADSSSRQPAKISPPEIFAARAESSDLLRVFSDRDAAIEYAKTISLSDKLPTPVYSLRTIGSAQAVVQFVEI